VTPEARRLPRRHAGPPRTRSVGATGRARLGVSAERAVVGILPADPERSTTVEPVDERVLLQLVSQTVAPPHDGMVAGGGGATGGQRVSGLEVALAAADLPDTPPGRSGGVTSGVVDRLEDLVRQGADEARPEELGGVDRERAVDLDVAARVVERAVVAEDAA